MQKTYRVAAVVAAIVAAVFSVMRCLWIPAIMDGRSGTAYLISAVVVVAAAVIVTVWCGVRREPLREANGARRVVLAGGAVFAGMLMAMDAVGAVRAFSDNGTMPYPQPVAQQPLVMPLFWLLVIFGFLGGVTWIAAGLKWLFFDQTAGFPGVLLLIPVLWIWVRLIRYITSFVSTTGLYRNFPELALLAFEMLFMLTFARYASGAGDRAPRWSRGAALSTVLLGVPCVVSQFVFYFSQEVSAFRVGSLLVSADAGIVIAAIGFVLTQWGETLASSHSEKPEQESNGLLWKDEPAEEALNREDRLEEDELSEEADEVIPVLIPEPTMPLDIEADDEERSKEQQEKDLEAFINALVDKDGKNY